MAPDCGFYAEQRPCLTYAAPGTARASARRPALQRAAARAYRERPTWRADPAERRRGARRSSPQAHEEIYAAVLRRERRMHVVILAASTPPAREPFAGGLESLTWHLVPRAAPTAAST